MTDVKIYVGCTGFNYEDWMANKGGFYPSNIEKYELLGFYSTVFPTCEINSTFYAFPRSTSTSRWAKLLPPDFILTAKLPKIICQAPNISLVEDKLTDFLKIMSPLKKNLGPFVCQFTPSFAKTEETLAQLLKFLDFFPFDDYDMVMEFRHESWFNQESYDILNDHNLGMVSSFLPYIKFNLYEDVKRDYFYMRLIGSHKQKIGDGKEVVDRSDVMEETADTIEKAFKINPNKKTAYVFINNHFSGYAPPAASKFKEMLEERKLQTVTPAITAFKGQQKLSEFFG
ncbi:MAG: DUF72 domain-containing protein [Candidatus Heimdallarchaeota archaeon]|nr:DUF72 domain-containing protein [Candidatus Heimdallarchaeota archaeon]MCK4878814.1 DUF72 domain-containing protein [Candidatus Heimdallarchaeota archaeon]